MTGMTPLLERNEKFARTTGRVTAALDARYPTPAAT